ncbi:tetratricopeptide repeat protein [Microbulbifer rhizosphaerae]|uniref:Flp pilus assembly protein TadD n=1 Tax=Microbulbifer rhizosphaerae TaxID=1562603 RepID=A0A7W4WEA5_9GAMM|nr:tetratricopeptide repeat protein [Microbulbifer rhizosphaerae]MBB3061971.1 Flp pilus assembly protein TadD [Microbulbifer rhizosphaerae]
MKISLSVTGIFFVVVFLGACTTMPPTATEVDTDHLLSGEPLLGYRVTPQQLPEVDILGLSGEMRELLDSIAPDAGSSQRLAALLKAFGGQFHVKYDADSTLTAAETFHEQRGNCMAFTVMMVAMTRALGAEAYFNQVEVPQTWDYADADTFVVYRHINMVSKSPRGRRVVDFDLAAYDPVYDQFRLSDSAAFAQFYSNRAVELLKDGDTRAAFLHMRKALELQPQGSELWANLGVIYGRAGFTAESEQSYLQAIRLKPANLTAISNLERLYRNSGRQAQAEHYERQARYYRERNPYYLYFQARNAYEHGEFELAHKRLRRALWKYSDDHRFHFLMGLTNYRLGDMKESHEHFTEAFSLAENPGTKNAYMRKLEYLQQDRQ